MGWPTEFPDARGPNALLIRLDPEAMVQDLGPFLTGQLMETDLLPGSAVICRADYMWRPIAGQGVVHFAFEGNANNAVNLKRYADRAVCAAGRLAQRAPSIAYGTARLSHVLPLARYDLDRHAILEVLDPQALSAQAGEAAHLICPDRIATPCAEIDRIRHLFELTRDSFSQDPNGVLGWTLMNGQVLVREAPGLPITLWSVEDPGFVSIARGLDLSESWVRRLFGRGGWPDGPVGPGFF